MEHKSQDHEDSGRDGMVKTIVAALTSGAVRALIDVLLRGHGLDGLL